MTSKKNKGDDVPVNVSIKARPGEHSERVIRRFIKKVKKDGVLEAYKQKTEYYIKPSVKRKIKRKKAQRAREREERKLQRRKRR